MRVLHILNDLSDRGNGIVNTAVDLALEQARQGLTVAVASAEGGYQTLLEESRVIHFYLNQLRRPAELFRAMRLLRFQLHEFQPDIVHAHMRTGLLLAWFWRYFADYSLVGHVHNVHDRESDLMGMADRVIAVSESVGRSMAARGIAQRKIRVVLNRTLGSPRVAPLSEIPSARLQRPSIVTVCGMNHRKGIAELLAAFEIVGQQVPNAHLYLVGDGPDCNEFERQAALSKWHERIHFEGYQSLPQAYMLSADAFVLASRRESFGLVLIEARQAGCAIVATNVDGVAEALDGGQAGMLVPAGDTSALARGLCLILCDATTRQQWQGRAKTGIQEFYIQRMAGEITTVYEELQSCKHRSLDSIRSYGAGAGRS